MRLWRNSLPMRMAIANGVVFITVLVIVVLASYVATAYLLQHGVDSALTSLARSTAEVWPVNVEAEEYEAALPKLVEPESGEYESGEYESTVPPEGESKPVGHEATEHAASGREPKELEEWLLQLPADSRAGDLSFIQVLDSQGNLVYQSNKERLPIESAKLGQAWAEGQAFTNAVRHEGVLAASTLPGWLSILYPEEDGMRIIYWPLSQDEQGGYLLQVGLPTAENAAILHGLGQILLVISLGSVVVVAVVSVNLARRAFKPVQEITEVAEQIDGRTLTSRIEVPVDDSTLYRLVQVLNAMLDRLETAFAAQTRFVNDAAHDMRTPLAAIRSELEITLRHPRTDGEYVQAIRESLIEVRSLASLTDNLLALARFDSGLQPGVELAFPLNPLLQRVNRELGELAEENQVMITMDLEQDLVLDCQSLAVERLFRNIMQNSIRYTPAGGLIELRAHTKKSFEGCEGIEINIRDTGIGISQEDLPHVFDRFYRADGARRRDGGGSGLGLAICQAIVQNHKGKLEIDSELGKGTSVTVWLPDSHS